MCCRANNNVHSQNIGLSLVTIINPQWSVSPSGSVSLVNVQSAGKSTTTNISIRVMNRMMEGKLSNSGGVGLMNSNSSRSISLTLQSGYALTSQHSINFSVRSTFYSYKQTSQNSFNEHVANLGYVFRF